MRSRRISILMVPFFAAFSIAILACSIGGFTIGATTLSAGSGVQKVTVDSSGSIAIGNITGARAIIYSDNINSLDGFALYNGSNINALRNGTNHIPILC